MGGAEEDKTPNCFRCWHCRSIEGMQHCCICMANITKKNKKPEFIEEPYAGECNNFWDKTEEEISIGQEFL